MDFFQLFDTSDFVPRWNCGNWSSAHGWVHIVSDLLISAAYTAIPIVLAYVVLRRTDTPFPRLIWLFFTFILACGTVHLIEAVVFWVPVYRVSAIAKVITAIVSWATVCALVPVARQVFFLRSPKELEAVNRLLQAEISERQAAEEKFRSFVESAPDALVVVNSRGRIELANNQCESIFGWKRQAIVGEEVEMLIPNRYHSQHRRHRERFQSSPDFRPMGAELDLFGLRHDGTEFPVEISLSPLRIGAELKVLAAVRDVTLRKEVEADLERKHQQLLQSERLAAIGEMVTGLAHESRNSLQRIQAGITMLERTNGCPPEQSALLAEMQDAQNNLHRLHEQLRRYAAPTVLDCADEDVGAVLDQVWRELEQQRAGRPTSLAHEQVGLVSRTCYVDRFAL